jgi:hypothetical protein
VWPGNTNDMSVLQEVKDDMRGWRLGRVVTVIDCGSPVTRTCATSPGGRELDRRRTHARRKPRRPSRVSRPGRYQQVRDNLRVEEGPRRRRRRGQAVHRLPQPQRSRSRQADPRRHDERLENELARIAVARAKANTAKASAAHHRTECALRAHPTLGRCVRQTTTCRLLIDRAKIKAEERLDGKYLLSTSDPDLSADDVALGYKNLLEAERGFRDLKSTLELRSGPAHAADAQRGDAAAIRRPRVALNGQVLADIEPASLKCAAAHDRHATLRAP